MTAAQKKAKENFKKAIAYRKISGCTLKEAFAKIYNKKTAPLKKATSNLKKLVDKAKKAYKEGYEEAAKEIAKKKAAKRVGAAPKKAAKKVVKKAAPKKAAKKKHTKYGKVKAHVRRVAGVKKAESIHKDTKSHNVNIRVVSGFERINFTRINNDSNGNPRYVVHFLNFLNDEERSFLPFTKKYEYAIKKAKLLGGKKYDNKQYGGGVVFQSYNTNILEKDINELREKTPKIKY